MPLYSKRSALVPSAHLLIRGANHWLAATAIQGYRYLSNNSHNSTLKYVKHAFPMDEAIKRISAADQARIFAPIQIDSSAVTTTDPDNKPFKKVLIPMFGINATISYTDYKGKYGVDRTVHTTDDKGNTTTSIETDWYYIAGQLDGCNYGQEYSYKMSIYAGSTYHHRAIEDALERHPIQNKLTDFDAEQIDKDIVIDCFDKKDAYARGKANERIHDAEYFRAKTDIERRVYCNHVRVNSVSINGKTTIAKNILPAYILKYNGLPPRVLAAIDEDDTNVIGPAPTSNVKVMATATTVAGLISLFLPPQISIPARMIFIAISAISSGLLSENKLYIQHSLQEGEIATFKNENDTISATHVDEERIKATSRDFIPDQSEHMYIDDEFYKVLGLNPDETITNEMLKEAVTKKLHQVHSDKGGSNEETRKVLEARARFNQALHQKPKSDGTKRYFSTYTRPPKRQVEKEPPRSIFYPNTGKLITAVLDEKNYPKALKMVMNEDVHPDGHDTGENTLLTEAVKRKDAKAVLFALKELKCSPDTSCDCPLHNTAMHYAAEGAHGSQHRAVEIEIINLLIKYGARINLINSRGKTPLDMATDETVKKLLISHGAIPHSTRPGIDGLLIQCHGFFGYGPDKRTLLEKQILLEKRQSSQVTSSDEKSLKR